MVDRDLRLGLQALHEGVIGPEQLCEAMEECLRLGASSLSEIFVARGWVSEARIEELERRVAEAIAATTGGLGSEPLGGIEAGTTHWFGGSDGDNAPGDLTTVEHASSGPTSRPTNGWLLGDRYERLRVHGVGGLGRVWLARDTHLGREVALKELRDDRPIDSSRIARFDEEARITSRLEHPGIVPLYDLVEGDGADTLPFYTMRFLAGRTLSATVEGYHRRRDTGSAGPLEFRGLLDAFRAVCQAVAFAHARGVLHRDLKGRNVILGEFGEVFVVDWGLAKSFKAAGSGERSTSLGSGPGDRGETEPGSNLGTPGYIAPELIEGASADRRSDVYSLGAILYLILAGRPSYVGESRGEILRAVRDREPERPRSLVRDVPRALEAICLKAMSRDPSSRYGTASELAEEVRRWQADEPVEAYRDPASRRLARWGRKHRAAVLAAFAALVSAVVGLSIATALIWAEQSRTFEQKQKAEIEWARAESNLELSNQVIFDLLRIADRRLSPIRGTEQVRVEIFDTSLKTFRSFLRQRPTDPSLRKWTAQIGRFYANVRRLLNDSEVAEVSYLESITLLESLVEQFPGERFYRAELAMTLGDYSGALWRLGRLREAAKLSRRAVEVAELLVREQKDRPEPRRSLASTLYALALIEGQMGNYDESSQLNRRAIEIYDGLIPANRPPSNPLDPLMMGSCWQAVALAEREREHFAEALEAADRGLALMRSLLDKNSRDNDASHNLGRLLLERARACSNLEGHRPEAEKNLEEAILIWGELAARYDYIPTYRESAALARQIRGALKDDARDLEDSRKVFEALADEFPDIPSYRAHLGRTYLEQGRLARAAKQVNPARELFTKAVDKLREVVEQAPENTRDRRSLDAAVEERSRLDPPSKP